MNYFTGSYIVTAIGFILAWLWGEHVQQGSGLMAIFIVFVLSILEISLSFDNAVVNALKLEKMSQKWRKCFLTIGIIIAVFGMRFLFPLLVVAIFANLNLIQVLKIAVSDSMKYAYYLQQTHAPIVAFGGTFLMMLFLSYFCNSNKNVHWIKPVETKCKAIGKIKGIEFFITLLLLIFAQIYISPIYRLHVFISGLSGIITYLIINGITSLLEKKEQANINHISSTVKNTGLAGFLYLELIDASFSLDGVLGAFALSRDIIIITIGLGIGAMFVRSLTIMLVEKNTLNKFLYLEHGAHWAIGALAVIMLISTFHAVPEFVTGLIGLVFIILSLISSILYNKRLKK